MRLILCNLSIFFISIAVCFGSEDTTQLSISNDSPESNNYFYSQIGLSLARVNNSTLLNNSLYDYFGNFENKNEGMYLFGIGFETNFQTNSTKKISDFIKIFDVGLYISLNYEFSNDALREQSSQKDYFESASMFSFELGMSFSFFKNYSILIGSGLGYLSYTGTLRERYYGNDVNFREILNNFFCSTAISNWEWVIPGRIGVNAEVLKIGNSALRVGFNWMTISSMTAGHDWKIDGTDLTFSELLPNEIGTVDFFEFYLGFAF